MPEFEEDKDDIEEDDDDEFNEEEQKLWDAAKSGDEMDMVIRMRDERERRELEERVKKQWPSTQAGQVFTQLADAFTACEKFMEEHPHVQEMVQIVSGEKPDVFTMLRDNLEKANRAPRCEKQKSNGQMCRAPKIRGEKYCCMHLAMEAARPTKFSLPPLDDANSIQVAIDRGIQGLVDGTLEEKRATKLGYFLQLAMSNVGRVNFEPEEEEEEESPASP